MQTRNEYIRYLNQVLGIRSILLPQDQVQKSSSWLFINELAPFSKEESDLFLKITAAMKLAPNDFELLNLDEKSISEFIETIQSAQMIICFQQRLFEYLRIQFPHAQIFLIPHPKEMIQNPELKKAAWHELQNAMKAQTKI